MKRMKQNFIITQMTQKKPKNSKIVGTKKLRSPDQRFNARVAFWKPDHRKNPSVVALVQGTNMRTDGVANSRGQGNETGIDWECQKKTRRWGAYTHLEKPGL